MSYNNNLISIACIVGFVGDALLQLSAKYLRTGLGLRPYFAQHGSMESLFIAGGMLTLFYVIYLYIIRLPVTYTYLAIYGFLLDLFFRKTMIFPSLTGYYKYFEIYAFPLNYILSGVWGAIPMMLPLFIATWCKKVALC